MRKLDNAIIIGLLCFLVVLIMGFSLFGFPGVLIILLLLFFFVVPFFMLLGIFALEPLERFLFSIFMGMGLHPFFVYAIYPVVHSLRAAVIIVTGFLYLLAAMAYYLKKKNTAKGQKTIA